MSTTRSTIMSESSVHLDEKYFGKTSKKSFVDTYRQLKHQGELLVGGYRALDELISQPMDQNILAKTVADLQKSGVLTPRNALGSPPKRPEFPSSDSITNIGKKGRKLGLKLMDDDDEDGTFLTKVGFEEDGDDRFDDGESADHATVESHLPFDRLDSVSELGGSLSHLMLPHEGAPSVDGLDFSVMTAGTSQEEDDAATEFSYRTQSPRAIFINGCLKNKIPPITIALVRRNLTSTINLAHMGIGDKIAEILAGCLSSLPYLQVLNLADNNLADHGLSELLLSASKHKEIEELDISNNTIGTAASKALGAFLAHPGCRLRSLKVRDANIDDAECANICGVLKANTSLRELDLSKNLLGKDENLNVVKPEFVTGGESLAELLHQGSCPIETLILHWNMIRLDGAIALCNAIQANRHLTHLDLSYNAIGCAGAEILGKSLLENSILAKLSVAHNSIGAAGCFALCIGVLENTTLREFHIDGNPIGAHGCMILTKAVLHSHPQLTITAQNCDFMLKHDNVNFDIADCAGSYVLDMAVTNQRAILLALLRTLASNPFLAVKALELPSEGTGRGAAATESFAVAREALPRTAYGDEVSAELEELTAIRNVSHDQVVEVCQEYDNEEADRFDTANLGNVLSDVGIPFNEHSLIEMKYLLDPFQYRAIDIRVFALYVENLIAKATQLFHELSHTRAICLQSASGAKVPFVCPTRGIVKVTVVEAFPPDGGDSKSSRLCALTTRQVKRVIAAAQNSTNSLHMLTCAVEGAVLYVEEAKLLFTELFTILDDAVAAVALLLPHMAGVFDANMLVRCCLGYDMKKVRRLQQKLGPLYHPLIGSYAGYYHVDFADPLSRQCWKMLLRRSLEVRKRRRFDGFGELSQHGDGICCFRNFHIVKPFTAYTAGANAAATATVGSSAPSGVKMWDVASSQDSEREALLAPLMDVTALPRSGKIEFDFVNSVVPRVPSTNSFFHALSDDAFIRILNTCQLLEDQDIDATLDRLLFLMKQSRKMMLSSGYQYWTPSLAFAIAAGDKLHDMYSTLAGRRRSTETVSKRESLEVDDSTDPLHLQFKVPTALKTRFLTSYRTSRTQAYVNKFTSLISNFGRSVRLVSKNTWINRLRNTMKDARPSAEYRSAHLLEYLLAELGHRWVYCRQLSVAVQLYSFGVVAHSNFGSYRVELIVKLFDRIVDLHNFQFVLMHLTSVEYAALLARIGILHFFNPCNASGGVQLDLGRWEERQVVKMLIHLSIVEPGDNFRNEEYAHDRSHAPIPGWELRVTWFQEDSLPTKGVLSLEVYSGEGMSLQDCQVNRSLRNMMMALVLPRQRNLHDEISVDKDATGQDRLVATTVSCRDRLGSTTALHVHMSGMADLQARAVGSAGKHTTTQTTPKVASTKGGSKVSSKAGSVAPTPPAIATPGYLTPLESSRTSVFDSADVVLIDLPMRLAYPQLSLFEHYESAQAHAALQAQAATSSLGSPKAMTKRASATAGAAMYAQQAPPGWVQTGSDGKFMKTYRLEDLHSHLRSRTAILWTYMPPVSGSGVNGSAGPTGGRAAGGSRGASRGNA